MDLVEQAKVKINDRLMWLFEAHEARKAIAKLPEPIQRLSGAADCFSSSDGLSVYKLVVELYGDDAFEVCKANGVEFGEPRVHPFTGSFTVQGKLGDVGFTVFRLSKPAHCEVIKVPYTAIKYESRCTEQAPDLIATNSDAESTVE